MGERARIARYFAPLAAAEAGSFFLTDDAAILTPPAGQRLVITTDSVIEAIHVLPGATPHQFAQKLVRRNLSDLAAMGAMPWRYTLNLHTPSGLSDDWFAAFVATLAHEQEQFGMVLVGGDSTSGGDGIHCTMTCFGLLDSAPLRRHLATIGDDVYVSGTIGGASFALHRLQHNQPIGEALAARYHCPEPRLALGMALRDIATSALDISDGLLADVTQLGAGISIERHRIPLPEELYATIATDESAWRFALSGGDDYELCFTAPVSAREPIQQIARQLALPLTRIGSVTANTGLVVRDENNRPLHITQTGYEHF